MEIFDKNTSFKDLGLSDDIVEQLKILNFEHPTQIQS